MSKTVTTNTAKTDRQKILAERLKKVGIASNRLRLGGDTEPWDAIPTGFADFDSISEIGGLPRKLIAEFCGESQAGKSTLSFLLAGEAHKLGLRVLFVNAEGSYDKERARLLGVNVDSEELWEVINPPFSAEAVSEFILASIESKEYGLVIIDSINALLPEEELEKDLSDPAKVGGHSVFVQRFLKKLVGVTYEANTLVVLINQFRNRQGVMGGMIKRPTGGTAMDQFCRVRLWFYYREGESNKIKGADGKQIGHTSKVQIYKGNIVGNQGTDLDFEVRYSAVERDLIAEFTGLIFKNPDTKEWVQAKSRGKTKPKMYYLSDAETGEVLYSSESLRDFILNLDQTPAPSSKTSRDPSTTMLQFLARLCKTKVNPQALLNQAMTNEEPVDGDESTSDDSN